ncbi:MAG: type IV secretion system DNA-binding domain-containing protein [Ruminococcus flavefaciens]|nr:type IV secretion system DNA-binding domain-containing protein [Ruminococcus flavefaciens]MCM1229436.1 type IV secretion system DNA-binding domain-containing protein [Ruminococcus flavefaciens]
MKQKNLSEANSTLLGYKGRKPVFSPDNAKHIFICGTTGSGKTVALSNYMQNSIKKDFPMLIIDGKGDTGKGSILDVITQLNKKYHKKIYCINLTNPSLSDTYNPFCNTSPTIAKDMLINMTDWSEEHYKVNAERYLQRLILLMNKAEIPLSFRTIVKNMELDKFSELSMQLVKEKRISKEKHLENLEIAKTSGKIAEHSIARFSTIAESELGEIFSDDGIDIATALHEKAIILFILNPLIYPEISPAFGRLVLIDSKKAISQRFQNGNRTFFLFDEINVYASKTLIDIVNKSRSANVTCVLATQSLSDLASAEDENFTQQIIENCNNYLVLRQNSAINAENWANILGTRQTMDVTYQLQQKGLDVTQTGLGSARNVREFLYHPDDIKILQTGDGIFLSRDEYFHSKIKVNKPF